MGVVAEVGWIALVSVVLLYYAGLGLARLLAFERISGGDLLIAPFVGLAVIICLGHWCGWMGWSANTALVATLVASTACNLLAFVKRPRRPLGSRAQLWTLVVAAFAFVLAVLPLWRADRLGPIGSNGDQVVYTNTAAYLEHNGLPGPSPSPSQPAITQLSFINWGHPLGFHYVHASIDRLTRYEAYETFAVVTALLAALNVLAYTLLAGSLLALGGETIHVRDDRDTDLLWVTYFLRNANLSLAHLSPYYVLSDWPFYQDAINADLVLVRKDAPLSTP